MLLRWVVVAVLFSMSDFSIAENVYYGGFSYLGHHNDIEKNYPYTSSINTIKSGVSIFDIELSKDKEVRTRFDQFQDKKIEEIPREFLEYGARDVIATYEAFFKLKGLIDRIGSASCLSHQIQLAGSIALNRVYKNGIGFDHKSSKEYLINIYKEMEICQDILATYGWARGVKGARELFNQVIMRQELTDLPLTSEGDFSSKEEDLKYYKDNRFIETYLKFIIKALGSTLYARSGSLSKADGS